MIGVDTNVLVRYLVKDEPEQFKAAASLFENNDNQKQGFFVSDIVLCELVWVLESAYKIKRDEVAMTLDRILRSEPFVFDHKNELWGALRDYRKGRADYADYLICRLGDRAGCGQTVTFDNGLSDYRLARLLG